MKKILNIYFFIGIGLLALFVVLMVLCLVTKTTVEGYGELVPLSGINTLIKKDVDTQFDGFTDICLYISLALCVLFAGVGIYQLVSERSLFKVDRDILFFGCALIIAIILWVFFDKVLIVNYRPNAIDEVYESSFPSTHVLLSSLASLYAAYFVWNRYTNKVYRIASILLAAFIVIAVTVGRVLAGMHYLTDVLGGLFLGAGLFFIVMGLSKAFKIEEKM